MTATQKEIIGRLPEFFHEAQRRSQLELEEEFLVAFMSLAGEPNPPDLCRQLLAYSSSCAITMIASFCARKRKRVALIEPVFDNIPSILRRENVELVPLAEERSADGGLIEAIAEVNPAVVWLVSPNNPTGWTVSERDFRVLASQCAEAGRVLVMDMSFRFFATSLATWSQYDILESSGCSYIVLEDTGKTFSTNEMKVGLTVCSADLYPEMYRLHDDLLQGVSPLHLRVLTEFIRGSESAGIDRGILAYVTCNREILRVELAESPLTFLTQRDSPVSVDWLHIDAAFDSETLRRHAVARGVHILPGTNFYWSSPHRGRSLLRIPLARDPALLTQGASILADTIERLIRRSGAHG